MSHGLQSHFSGLLLCPSLRCAADRHRDVLQQLIADRAGANYLGTSQHRTSASRDGASLMNLIQATPAASADKHHTKPCINALKHPPKTFPDMHMPWLIPLPATLVCWFVTAAGETPCTERCPDKRVLQHTSLSKEHTSKAHNLPRSIPLPSLSTPQCSLHSYHNACQHNTRAAAGPKQKPPHWNSPQKLMCCCPPEHCCCWLDHGSRPLTFGPLNSSRISASTWTSSRYGWPTLNSPLTLCANTRPMRMVSPTSTPYRALHHTHT